MKSKPGNRKSIVRNAKGPRGNCGVCAVLYDATGQGPISLTIKHRSKNRKPQEQEKKELLNPPPTPPPLQQQHNNEKKNQSRRKKYF